MSFSRTLTKEYSFLFSEMLVSKKGHQLYHHPTPCASVYVPPQKILRCGGQEIISWNSASPDGKALRALFDAGMITNETAKQVRKEYPRFRPYASRTLNSALNNERKRIEKEVDTQQARGSSGEFDPFAV